MLLRGQPYAAAAVATIAGVRLGRIDTIFLVCAALIVAGAVYAGVALRGADEAATSAQPAPTR